LSIVDVILAVIILGGAFSGYKNGSVTSLFSLVAIILGMLIGFKLMGSAMVLLARNYNVDEKVLPYLAFGIVFLIIVIVVNVIGRFIRASIDKPILGGADRIVGAILGMVHTLFSLSIMLWIADSLRIKIPEAWAANSWLQPKAATFAPKIANWIGEFLPIFRDVL
jgi:membrane protein required for colicin V production